MGGGDENNLEPGFKNVKSSGAFTHLSGPRIISGQHDENRKRSGCPPISAGTAGP